MRPSPTQATTTTASRLAPREMVNVPAMGQVSTVASTLSVMVSAQPSAGVGEEQVDAAAVGDQVVVHAAAGGVLLLDVAQHLLEVVQEAVDHALEGDVGLV